MIISRTEDNLITSKEKKGVSYKQKSEESTSEISDKKTKRSINKSRDSNECSNKKISFIKKPTEEYFLKLCKSCKSSEEMCKKLNVSSRSLGRYAKFFGIKLGDYFGYSEKEILVNKIKTIQSELKQHKINTTFYQQFPEVIKGNENQIQNFRLLNNVKIMKKWIQETQNYFIHREGNRIKCLWPDCTKEISRKHPGRLRAHISKHFGLEVKIECPHCNLALSNKSNLKRHLVRKHPSKFNKTVNNNNIEFYNQIDVKNAVRLWDSIIGINYDRFCKKFAIYLFHHNIFKDAREIIADAQLSLKYGKDQITFIPDITIYHEDNQLSFLDFKTSLNTIWINPNTLNYIIEYYPTSSLILCFLKNEFSNSLVFRKTARKIVMKILERKGILSNDIPGILSRVSIWLVEEDFAQLIPANQKDTFLQELTEIKSMNSTSHDIVLNVQVYLKNLNEKLFKLFEANFPDLNKDIIKQDINTILDSKLSLYRKVKSILILEEAFKSKYVTSEQISKKFCFNLHRANQYLSNMRNLGILKHKKFYRNYLSFYKFTQDPSISEIIKYISPLAKIGYQELIERKFVTRKELEEKIKDKNFFGSIQIYGLILINDIKFFLPNDIKLLIKENLHKYNTLVKMNETTVKQKLYQLTQISALRIIYGNKKRNSGYSGYNIHYYLPQKVTYLEALREVRPKEVNAINFLSKKLVLNLENIKEDDLRQLLSDNWHFTLMVLSSLIDLSDKQNNYISHDDVIGRVNLAKKNIQTGLKILIDLNIVKTIQDGHSEDRNLVLL